MTQLTVRKGASRASDPAAAAKEIHAAIYNPEAALSILYCSADYDLDALGTHLSALFGDTPLIGATTAGEIGPEGFLDGGITGVSIGGPGFDATTVCMPELRTFELADGVRAARSALERLGGSPTSDDTLGFLLVDGLSMQEEAVVAALHRSLGDLSLFGGSAGDGTRFGSTHLYYRGRFRTDCALFTLVRSPAPFSVFKTEHFVPSSQKMVVTASVPARRIVWEIDGEPAAAAYARCIGVEVEQLTPEVLAAYPVVISIGGLLYVRSVQAANEDGSLSFLCSIDEGTVLTVADKGDMVDNLRAAFERVREQVGEPALVLGCDCLLRRIEANATGTRAALGQLMAQNNVVGFATYGEQYNGVHVNQTFTGVALGSQARSPSTRAGE